MLLIDCLEAVTNECALDNCNIVILGDLNVNMLKSNVLSDWLDISGLKNVIKEPTCKKGLPSLLDVLITNKPKRLQYSSSLYIGLSDFHNLVCAGTKFHVSKRKRTNIFYRSYKNSKKLCFYMLCLLPRSMSQKYLMKLMTHTGCVVPYFNKLSMNMPPLNRRQLRVITYHI